MIEVIAAGAEQATFNTGTVATVTITFAEAGVARLRDLVLSGICDVLGAGTDGISNADVIPFSRVRAVTLNGSTLFVRGRNTASGPAAIFSPKRRGNFVQLPDVRVNSGDTLAITLIFDRTTASAILTAAVPFAPDRFRGMQDAGLMGQQGEIVACSPDTTFADTSSGTAFTVTNTFDTPGLIDLSRLVIAGGAVLPTEADAPDYAPDDHDQVPFQVNQLILRSDYNIVTGGSTASSPNIFKFDRSRNWVNLGIHRVAPGDTLVATLDTLLEGGTMDNVIFSSMVPLYPDQGFGGLPGGGGACNPCG